MQVLLNTTDAEAALLRQAGYQLQVGKDVFARRCLILNVLLGKHQHAGCKATDGRDSVRRQEAGMPSAMCTVCPCAQHGPS